MSWQTIIHDKYVVSDCTTPPYPCLLSCSVVLFGGGGGIVIILCLLAKAARTCTHILLLLKQWTYPSSAQRATRVPRPLWKHKDAERTAASFAWKGKQKEQSRGCSRSMLPCLVFPICWMSSLYACLIDGLIACSGDKGDVSQSVWERERQVRATFNHGKA